jgi:hypothetical protein
LLRLLPQVHVYEFRYVQIVENIPICGYIHSKGIPAEKNNTEHYIQKDAIGKQIMVDF